MRFIAALRHPFAGIAAGGRGLPDWPVPVWAARLRHLPGRVVVAAFLTLAPLEALAWGVASHAAVVATVAAALAVLAAVHSLTAGSRIALSQPSSAPDAAKAREDDLREALAAQTAGEDLRRREVVNQMAEAIEHGLSGTLDPLMTATSQIRHISDTIAAGAERLGGNAVASSEAADVAAGSARQLAETADSLNTAIQQVADQVGQATGIARAAVAAGQVAMEVIETLSGHAASIQSVVDLIGSIAAQTNLLALNATIEAARAGEAGRGFAVVANEVKALARKTAQSTATVGQTIGAVRASNLQAVDAVQQMVAAVGAMDAIAATIAVSIAEQRVATATIAERVNETVENAQALVDRINDVTIEVGANFECAAEVHLTADAITAAITVMIAEFKQSVSRAVRTATPDANRRHSPRIAIDPDCFVTLDGAGQFSGRMLDASQGGARLRITTPAAGFDGLQAGVTTGSIGLDPDGPAIGFVLVDAHADEAEWELRLRFTETPEGWDQVLQPAA
jgi:methyl-accepting chemotaxis protein